MRNGYFEEWIKRREPLKGNEEKRNRRSKGKRNGRKKRELEVFGLFYPWRPADIQRQHQETHPIPRRRFAGLYAKATSGNTQGFKGK